MKITGFYRVIRAVARLICFIVFPSRVSGRENIPEDGPVLLCSNHVSFVDPVIIAVALRRQVSYLAKKEIFSTRFTNWFFTQLGMVPVDRGASDIAALRVCLDVLGGGKILGVFPQGHRYRHDENREIQNGAALMALRSGAVVVPVHVSAPLRCFRRTHIRFGAPIDLSDMTRVNSQAIQATSERITEGIWQEG